MDDSRIPYKQRIAEIAQLDQALYSSEDLNHSPVPLCRILCMRRCLYSLSVFDNEDSRVLCRFSKTCQPQELPNCAGHAHVVLLPRLLRGFSRPGL
jgi:hypothetical protein